jgi:hypothetical protein
MRYLADMWPSFDPHIRRELDHLRQVVSRRHQTPTREWPLTFVEEHDALFVVRQWPDGSITAYATSDYRDLSNGDAR